MEPRNTWLSQVLTRFRAKRVVDLPEIAPQDGFYAIGDVHGRIDLLERVLRDLPRDLRIVCLGDYVDRGENSAEVLRLLHSRPDITALRGNHEDMLLRFLDDPKGSGARWIRYGGLQTLASFGLPGLTSTSDVIEMKIAADALRARMGADLVEWLRFLPFVHQDGNVAAVHAGADPSLSIQDQKPSVLTWGHPDFPQSPRGDGLWIVHGHTIVDQAHIGPGHIAVDTGAYATGRLSVARITSSGVEFDST